MATRKAYSYIRFSSAEQQKGDSLRRQIAVRDAFLARYNSGQKKIEMSGQEPDYLELDHQIQDLGLSGYKGEHLEEGGALAAFLDRIQLGEIKPGSVLLVEHLDRLGRMEPIEQLSVFIKIIRSGVELVTLNDEMWFSREMIKKSRSALVVSLLGMTQSFDESDKKATRLAAVWEGKRLKIEKRQPVTSVCPGWMKLNANGAFELIEERANLVQEIFARTLRGDGKRTIAYDFNRRKIQTWGIKDKQADGWHDSYIQKILRNDAVIGRFQPHTTRETPGKRVPIGKPVENYYPAVISLETWQAAQGLRKGSRGRRADTVKNLFIGLVRDGLHGCNMNFVDKGGSKNGRWQYLVSDYRRTHPDEESMRWKYREFEEIFLRAMIDYDWQQPRGRDPEMFQLESKTTLLESRQAELAKQGKNLAKAIASGTDAAFVRDEMLEVEKQALEVGKELKVVQDDLRARKASQAVLQPLDNPDKIYELRHDEQMRSKLRLEIRQRVVRIDVFSNGTIDLKDRPALPEPWDLYCEIHPGMKVTLVNAAQIWIFASANKITVIEQPPAGQVVSFWRTTKKELKGWEYLRGMTNSEVNALCEPKAP